MCVGTCIGGIFLWKRNNLFTKSTMGDILSMFQKIHTNHKIQNVRGLYSEKMQGVVVNDSAVVSDVCV